MKQEKESLIIGIVSSGIFTSVTALILGFSGLTYYDPPPPEKPDIVIDFNEILAEDKKPEQRWDGARPKAEEVTKKVELVQQSEAQYKGATQNVAEEATIEDNGDVERPEPPRKEKINKKALFTAADNKGQKDTLAAQTAREVTEALKAGHALGNIEEGKTDGQPKAELKGRTVIGSLPRPSAPGQQVGKVIVDIWVDPYGQVTKAVAGAKGTTVSDAKLWKAAEAAAMKATFNMDGNAAAMQKGRITYIFKVQ